MLNRSFSAAARPHARRLGSVAVSIIATTVLSLYSTPSLAVTNKNLVTDGGVTTGSSSSAIAVAMQGLLDTIAGDSQGGTLTIPSDSAYWVVDRPIFVGGANITIAGQGDGTRLQGIFGGSLFILGAKDAYSGYAITANHHPSTTTYLDSSAGGRYGLRTYADSVSASGYFPASAFCNGPRRVAGGYDRPSFWRDDSTGRLVLDLCVRNNGTGVMKGTIWGMGAGGANKDITDPLTIFTIESSPSDGTNVKFRFKTVNSTNVVTTNDLLLSATALGTGIHRFSVEVDLVNQVACAWFSTSTANSGTGLVTPTMSAKLTSTNLAAGLRFDPFIYGAMKLGQMTDHGFSGTPSAGDGVNGDWTYCGCEMGNGARYTTSGSVGSTQTVISGTLNDAYRYFSNDNNVVAWLPLTDAPPSPSNSLMMVVHLSHGNAIDGQNGNGYFLPDRPLSPISGTITVQDIRLTVGSFGSGSHVTIAEAQNAVLNGVRVPFGGGAVCIGSWDVNPAGSTLQMNDCFLSSNQTTVYAKGQKLSVQNLVLNGYQTEMCLVGCSGEINDVLITNFPQTDHLFEIRSGPTGGPLSFHAIANDNEGYPGPNRALFYAEPSMNAGSGGTVLHLSQIYGGESLTPVAFIELADPPGSVSNIPPAKIIVEDADCGGFFQLDSLLLCSSSNWYGRFYDLDPNWDTDYTYGPIDYTGPSGGCHLQTVMTTTNARSLPIPAIDQWSSTTGYSGFIHSRVYRSNVLYRAVQDNSNVDPATDSTHTYWLPTTINYLAGCHVVETPFASLQSGSKYTEYRVTTSGKYGTGVSGDLPTWTGYNPTP